jgi:hypothetical protein
MATRLTPKTVALGNGGPELAVPGASYGDRRAMLACPRLLGPPGGVTGLHETHEFSNEAITPTS